MIDDAIKALRQMASPPFRAVLLKAIGLALILIVVIGVGLHRLMLWLTEHGEGLAENALGSSSHGPLGILVSILSIAAGLGIVVGAVFLMPAITSLVASFFVDDVALEVERVYYSTDPAGQPVPLPRAVWEGVKIALLSVLVYLVALPFLLFAGFGVLIFFFATAYLLGRQYFEYAAMRFRSAAEAKQIRRRYAGTVYTSGLMIALFVSIPVINFATPLFGMALMVHTHKRLSARRELIEAGRAVAR
ncbi:MAG: sulfate transporter family protein [Xanthobacteraceae bacterium]